MPVAIIGLLVGGQLIGVIDVNGSGNNLGEGPFEELIFDNTATNMPTFKFIEYFGDKAFLIENSEVATDIGIYTTDGTNAGTQMVWSPPNNGPFRYISEMGTSFLFQLNGELWASDGTVAGTQQVFDFSSTIMCMHLVGPQVSSGSEPSLSLSHFLKLTSKPMGQRWNDFRNNPNLRFPRFQLFNNVVHNECCILQQTIPYLGWKCGQVMEQHRVHPSITRVTQVLMAHFSTIWRF